MVEEGSRSQPTAMSPVPILVLLQQCIGALGGLGTAVNDPANMVALELLVAVLDAAPSPTAAAAPATAERRGGARPTTPSTTAAAAPDPAERRGGARSTTPRTSV